MLKKQDPLCRNGLTRVYVSARLTQAGDASCPLSLQRSSGTSSASDSLDAVISSIAASLLAIASSVLAFSASLLARSLSPNPARCCPHHRQTPAVFEGTDQI